MTPGDFQILKSTTTEPSFRAAEESDSETLIAFMREYYALDGRGFDERKAHVALTTLLRNPNLGRVWLILDGEPVGYVVICFGHSLEWAGARCLRRRILFARDRNGSAAASVLQAKCIGPSLRSG